MNRIQSDFHVYLAKEGDQTHALVTSESGEEGSMSFSAGASDAEIAGFIGQVIVRGFRRWRHLNANGISLRADVLDVMEMCEEGDDNGDHKFTPGPEYVLEVIAEKERNMRIYETLPTLSDIASAMQELRPAR